MKNIKSVAFLIFVSSLFVFQIQAEAIQQEVQRFTNYYGEETDDFAGLSLSHASKADVNGDGYDDLLIGAEGDDTVGSRSGAVYLIYGSPEQLTGGSLINVDAKFLGEAAGDRAGMNISFAGDVNGDGYDDILIGVDRESSNGSLAGATYLIYGQADKFSGDINLTNANAKFLGETAGDRAGSAVSTAGDINNDGYNDFLIGAYQESSVFSKAGAVYLIYGQAEQFSGTIDLFNADAKFIGEAVEDYAGNAVSSAGDINGDNYTDIIIGAIEQDTGNDAAGAVYLIYGNENKLSSMDLSNADVVLTGEGEDDYAGSSLSLAGDVNNDGYSDILIGAWGTDTNALFISGTVYLIYGNNNLSSTSLSSADASFTGEFASDQIGSWVGSEGDINNDGYSDIIIGAKSASTLYHGSSGAVFLFYGQRENISSKAIGESDVKFYGQYPGDYVGGGIYFGDLNGDDFDDLVIGAGGADVSDNDEGITYLSYLYIDADGDGTAGSSGLFAGEDCDDNNSSINPSRPEISGNNVDDDCDGDIDEVNTGTHPDYENYNPADTDLHDLAISYVKGYKNGKITVKYKDNSIYRYTVFDNNSISRKTKIKHYKKTGYYLIAQAQGKKIALVNIYNGETLDRKIIAKKAKYKYNSLKNYKLRKKNWAVLTSKQKDGTVRLAAVRIKINQESFGKRNRVTLEDAEVKPKNIKRNNNKIYLRDTSYNILHKYIFTKKNNLKALE